MRKVAYTDTWCIYRCPPLAVFHGRTPAQILKPPLQPLITMGPEPDTVSLKAGRKTGMSLSFRISKQFVYSISQCTVPKILVLNSKINLELSSASLPRVRRAPRLPTYTEETLCEHGATCGSENFTSVAVLRLGSKKKASLLRFLDLGKKNISISILTLQR